jgi:NIPSNAP
VFLEIRSYQLRPGRASEFERLARGVSLPMLHRHGIDLVAFGPSLLDPEAFHLIRAYGSLEELERSEAAFYGSAEWREGPRDAIMACIDRYVSIVLELDDVTIDGLRRMSTGQ